MNQENDNITVITTHINADFDALASLLAAQKLYPDSLIVFPGSQEKNLRNFFISSMVYLFNMADVKSIDFTRVKKLVLVDTRQPGRIGKLSELLNNSELVVHIFDHHPANDNDIKGQVEVLHSTGATVTILTEIIKKQNIPINSDEATIMCLGIYEDTGSFTFPSTTERDFMAAAFLLSNGANLNIISNMIAREISPEQVSLLNDMIQSSTNYNINGIHVVIAAVAVENYIPDFAFLIHKMIKMENLNTIFGIALMENKLYIVARSRTPEVDVGHILSFFGGGGHAYAAAATVKGKTLPQIEQELYEVLLKEIKSNKRASYLMTSPPIMIGPEMSCKKASQVLTRYNINALIVAQKNEKSDELFGFVSRQIIEKAVYHHLDDVQVSEYMTTELVTVAPDADLDEIQDKIIDSKQRLLPVIDQGRILGVITRSDLLNTLVDHNSKNQKSSDFRQYTASGRTKNIDKFLYERLPNNIIDILMDIGKVAAELNYNAYVVGGFVRDLFMYRTNEDIDIVVEGDGIQFAKKYARVDGVRIHCHEKFGTAVIIFPDGFKIDVASARLEYYQFPAALPTVEMSSIKLDLFRRDFTINTLAIQLNPDKFGTLIDFFLALRDIKEKAIRVLHNLSFVEDPTRVFRAIRFEQRFGFSIGKLTSNLIENAVKIDFFKRLSGRRVFSEMRQILEEEEPTLAILRLHDFDLLKVIHSSIKPTKELILLFNAIKKVLAWHDLLFLKEPCRKWIVYFLALIRACDRTVSRKICDRLELSSKHIHIFCQARFEADKCIFWLERNTDIDNSTLYRNLTRFKTEVILYMMAATSRENIKMSISHYFTQLKHVKVITTGNDLKQMGFSPGPIYREILEALLDERLNGNVRTKKDETNFINNSYNPS